MIEALAITIPVFVAAGGFTYKLYSNRQNDQDKKITANSDSCSAIKLDVATIQTDVGHIKEDIKESKDTYARIFEKIDEINKVLIIG